MECKSILVKNLPPPLLKKKEIRSHFGKFGDLTKIEVSSKTNSCALSFLTSSQAKAAKSDGSDWNNQKVDIVWDVEGDRVLEELNWFAEDPLEDVKEKVKRFLKTPKQEKPEPKKPAVDRPEPKKPTIPIFDPEPKKNKMEEEEPKFEVKSESELLSKVAVTNKEKLSLLEERDKLIRSKLVKLTAKPNETLKGTCPDMCPEKERIMREVRTMVAPYETLGEDGKLEHVLAVKEYTRSSADQEEPLPHELRPESVLTMTMEYLIINIMGKIENEDENVGYWFDFCWGRLRAIRKDIIQQQLCDLNVVAIVEQCARFHILCFDRLWGSSKTVFDDKINSETLMNCLQSLMHMYEDLKKQNILCPNEAEFKAYLILLKLSSGFLLSEYQQYSDYLQSSPEVIDAVSIHTAYSNNMYATYFKLCRKTTYLNICLMQRFFAHLRVNALSVIVRAHCTPNKLCRLPVNFIKDALKFDEFEDTVLFCESFGIGISKDNETFLISRNNFYFPESIYMVDTPSSLIINKRIPVAEAVSGVKNLPIYLPHDVHTSFTIHNTLKPSSLDASDQEEKMLRDAVERQLLKRKRDISAPKPVTVEKEPNSFIDCLIANESNSDTEQFEMDVGEEETDIYQQMDDYEVDKEEEDDYDGNSSVYSESGSSVAESIPATPSPVLMPQFQFKLPSPKISEQVFVPPSAPVSKFLVPISPVRQMQSPVFKKPALASPLPKNAVSPPTTPLVISPPASTSSHSEPQKVLKIQKEKPSPEENLVIAKLRKKLTENMKRTAAKKYMRIWKLKVEKIKRARESEKTSFFHIPLQDYTKLWGGSSSKQNLTYERLKNRKKASLLVTAILHTNLVDQLDQKVKKVNHIITNILTSNSIRFAHKFGNIAQPIPVFWKLIIALPQRIPEDSTFPMKLRHWCRAAFYPDGDKNLGDVQFSFVQDFVPIFIRVNIIEGVSNIQICSNVSALIVVTGKGWEEPKQTTERLDKILSKMSSKIPVSILHLGANEKLNLHVKDRNISFLHQAMWDSIDSLVEAMSVLALKTPMYNLKVEPLGRLIEVTSERFLDALHEDRFIDDSLYDSLSKPNNVIYLYNLLVDKIDEEILHCCTFNLYGTANEFKENLRGNLSQLPLFPEHYNDPNFKSIHSTNIKLLKLRYIKEEYESSIALLKSFREYCQNLNCSHILSKLIRIINPPDDDQGVDLSAFLTNISWLPIVELIIKEHLRNLNLDDYGIVYRGDKINDLVQSHWWLHNPIKTNTGLQ